MPHASESEASSADGSQMDPNTRKRKAARNLASSLASARKKKKSKSRSERRKIKADKLAPYRKFAKWYMRTEDMLVNYYQVLHYGMRWETDQFGTHTPEEFEAKYHKSLMIYAALREQVPTFFPELQSLLQDPEAVEDLAKTMTDAANAARGDDIGSLLDKGLVYVALEQPGHVLTPPIHPNARKNESRGHHHPVLSRLLCPVRYLNEFDRDPPSTMKKLRTNKLKILYGDLAAYMYPDRACDPRAADSGLFRNPIGIRFFRHLFVSPQSALQDEPVRSRSKPGQAKLNNMTEVTPGSIAYTLTLLRHTISSVGDWRDDDLIFDRVKAYYEIRDAFEREDNNDWTSWSKETLQFWTSEVFGELDAPSSEESNDDTTEARPYSFRALKKQRLGGPALRDEENEEPAHPSSPPRSPPRTSSPTWGTGPPTPDNFPLRQYTPYDNEDEDPDDNVNTTQHSRLQAKGKQRQQESSESESESESDSELPTASVSRPPNPESGTSGLRFRLNLKPLQATVVNSSSQLQNIQAPASKAPNPPSVSQRQSWKENQATQPTHHTTAPPKPSSSHKTHPSTHPPSRAPQGLPHHSRHATQQSSSTQQRAAPVSETQPGQMAQFSPITSRRVLRSDSRAQNVHIPSQPVPRATAASTSTLAQPAPLDPNVSVATAPKPKKSKPSQQKKKGKLGPL
ncbi:hypothetical protein CPC08DRAFT_755773 [Agrocybe pediades]|nr:hypothetical protein CPC08DRAFT_755773 [Agrocybe pediades]